MSNTKPPPHPEQPERACNTHPDAPHGFDRTASHSAGRYVCECEGWQPPAGWKLVPTEPTTEMVVAARAAAYSAQCDASFSDCKQIYRAILSAAPAAPQPPAQPANAELLRALVDLEAEFRRVFPIYYYGEPWAHDKNVPLKVAQEVISHAKAQPVREPLTDAEIDEACRDIYGSDHGGTLTLSLQRAIARAIERAHGIGEDK